MQAILKQKQQQKQTATSSKNQQFQSDSVKEKADDVPYSSHYINGKQKEPQSFFGNLILFKGNSIPASFSQDYNRAVTNKSPLIVQAKLMVNEPGDIYEREADSVSNQVMTMPGEHHSKVVCNNYENKKEQVYKKPLAASITPFRQVKEFSSIKPADSIAGQINASKGSGSHLPESTRYFMESRFGIDFSHVRIHTDSLANRLSGQLNAKAFTAGNDIYFNKNQFVQGSSNSNQLLAHELKHTVQQTAAGSPRELHSNSFSAEKTENTHTKNPSYLPSITGKSPDSNQVGREIIQRHIVEDGEATQQALVSKIHNIAYSKLNRAYSLTYHGMNNHTIQQAVFDRFKFLVPSINNDAGNVDLWNKILWALYTMLINCNSAVYEIETEQTWMNGFCAGKKKMGVSLDNIHLCPLWFMQDTPLQVHNLLHEWGHKYGKGINRIWETYNSDTDEYDSLPADEKVKTPDAYADYIFTVAT